MLTRRTLLAGLASGAAGWPKLGTAAESLLKRFLGGKPKKPKVTVSKKTTYLTGPLLPDGSVDFIAGLNEMFGRGVTPENNAMVPLVRAFGPKEIDASIRAEYFKRLGIEELPVAGDYLVSFDEFANQRLPNATTSELETLSEQLDIVMSFPWPLEEFPVHDAWIEANRGPLAWLRQAATRTRLYSPMVRKEGGTFSEAWLGSAFLFARDGLRLLAARAMRSIGEGKMDGVWEDLVAICRLGRLSSSAGYYVDLLTGRLFENSVLQPMASWLHAKKPMADEIASCQKQIEELPARPALADIWDQGERCYTIGYALDVAAGTEKLPRLLTDEPDPKDAVTDRLVKRSDVDWDEVLTLLNESHDELVAALRQPEEQCEAALEKQAQRAKEIVTELGDVSTFEDRLRESPDRKRLLSLFLVHMVFFEGGVVFAYRTGGDLGFRTYEALFTGVFALAAYRAAHGRYPARLADLVPKHLAAVPKDPHSGGELVYRPDKEGYRLYSVGLNKRDDGGRNWDPLDEDSDADDIGIRAGSR